MELLFEISIIFFLVVFQSLFGVGLLLFGTPIFLLLGIGIVFIALLFYTLETLLAFGIIYLLSIPISMIIYSNQNKKQLENPQNRKS